MHGYEEFVVTTENRSRLIKGDLTSPNYFETLGVHLTKGRSFTDDENRPDAGLVAVISHRLWRDSFKQLKTSSGKPSSSTVIRRR